MRVVLAPDKFKGTLTAREVCEAMTLGLHDYDSNIEVINHPLADGGEGTSDLLEEALSLKKEFVKVNDPLFRPVFTHYLRSDKVAFIEMANASGLQLLKEHERNALQTSSFGTGEMIEHALDQGVDEVYLMIGGSATSDGGVGMANAIGYGFKSLPGKPFGTNGSALRFLSGITTDQLHHRVPDVTFTVLCDVQNPLLGPNGAAHVYGPQKGADKAAVELLEAGLANLAKIFNNGLEYTPGAGAAGGLGYGAMSFLGASLKPGIEAVMEMTGFDQALKGADLVITGEGKMDLQTVEGKVIAGVAQISRKRDLPFAVVCGMAQEREQVQAQLQATAIYPLVRDDVTPDYAMKNAFNEVRSRTKDLIQTFCITNS